MACGACWGGKAELRHRLQAPMEGEEDALHSSPGWLGDDDLSVIYHLMSSNIGLKTLFETHLLGVHVRQPGFRHSQTSQTERLSR